MTEVYNQDTKNLLKQIVSKLETLEEEKLAVQESIKEVLSEAKANGFDTKIIKTVMKLRKMDQSKLLEQEELIDLYKHALDMI
jgi:uncharacterized protein (UPF0335 family)